MKFTLSVKLFLANILVLVVVLGTLLVAISHYERRIITEHICDTGEATGRRIARQALLGGMTRDLAAMTRLVSQLTADDASVKDVVITDRHDRILSASNPQLIGEAWAAASDHGDLVVDSPILDGEGQLWGTVHMTYSLGAIQQVVGKTREIIFLIGGGACVFGVLMSVLMARYLTGPLRRLWQASIQIACGEYQCDLPTKAEADIAQIADGFQTLIDTIRQSEAKLRQAERHAAIGSIAAHAAHELKNSLTPIKSFSSALASPITQDAPPQLARYLQRASSSIPRAVERVEHLTVGLLNLAKAPEYHLEVVDCSEIGRTAVELMYDAAANRFIELEFHQPSAPVHCRVDREQMEGVLINLISNALEAMRMGGRIDLGVEFDEDTIFFTVRDDGPGIQAAHVKRIFDPYFSTKKGGANAGLGLALVQKFVLEHGGRIDVASTPDLTTFTISLPRTLPDAESTS